MRLRAFLTVLLLLPSAGVLAGDFFKLTGHGGPVRGIDVSPDGSRLLTASFDYSVGLWQAGAPIWLEAHDAAVNAVRFIDASTAVSAGDDNHVRLWDLERGVSERLGSHRAKVVSLALSPDRSLVASASWDGRIGLWPVSGAPARFLEGHSAGVNDVVFSADGARLYSGSTDGTVRVWDVARGVQTRHMLKGRFGINTLALDEEAGWLAYGGVDGATRILDLESAREIADFTLQRRPILAMAFDAESDRLAVGDGEGFIKVIDSRGWTVLRDFRAALRGPVWAVAFSADGQDILAAGIDDALYSWPVAALGSGGLMGGKERSFLRDPASMGNGERQFQRKCSICHTLGPEGLRRAGPTLFGIFGRPAGGVSGYKYSRTLREAEFVWNEDTIDALFDEGPDRFVPGTKMPMQRIAKPADRDDLIAFLKYATKEGGRQR
ncbi:MAG: c-type cytochrome [Alphaproteobacteria bacterium]|nr:c-type cytochrome [Alphaproteobacteria bacterium]